jgi:formylglycine-generating enzyme required for sulfatase activity
MKITRLNVCVLAVVVLMQATDATSNEADNSQAPAADPMRGKKPGDVRDDNGLKMPFVWCPPGVVTMENVEVIIEPAPEKIKRSSDDEFDSNDEPAPAPKRTERIAPVKVFVSHYWIGKYEVTQSEWTDVMQTEPWKGKPGSAIMWQLSRE